MNTSRLNTEWIWAIIAVVAFIGMLYLLAPILTPFLIAGILAYICDPLADRLERLKFSRTLATLVVLMGVSLIFLFLALLLLPVVQNETAHFIGRLPDYLIWIQTRLAPMLHDNLGLTLPGVADLQNMAKNHMQGVGNAAGALLPTLKSGTLTALNILVNALLIPVALFYMLRDWDSFMLKLGELVPRRWHEQTLSIAREIDSILAQFLRGQILVMLIMAAFYATALWAVGLEYALPIGMLAGLLIFIPYVGATLGLGLASLAGLVQFNDIADLIPVWVVFGAGQAIESMGITPWLVGERIGLHPLAVIFALMAFGQIFGFFGILLALPISAALWVGLRHVKLTYQRSNLYRHPKV
ncbi:AI-2E family transporter [Sulfuriferula sp. AH1]|uniref:AI-2E family transporter n=1 Tax=Sulfuriferula sp. AH1 TaxID=1985873 RepID=UPI000B3B90F5|nr:AI-2E family transporter [Sulfuriferula sp. AH1]ARU30264.1 AI-2E family transporter [Sulfuriferula sp. AH1]